MIDIKQLNFDKGNGLIPCVIQDSTTKDVLMLGYMNAEAVEKTISLGKVTFWSRTKERLWTKGEESGNHLLVEQIDVDCDNDTLLIKAKALGPTCHTGTTTCWGAEDSSNIMFLSKLQSVIQDRKSNPSEKSYTTSLFQKGINKVAQKVGEEAVELVIEAKDENDDLFLNEAADLMYHYIVLLTAKGFTLEDVVRVLEKREK